MIGNDAIKLVLRRPAIPLHAFSNNAKTSQSHTGQRDIFGRRVDAINGRCVDQDRADIIKIHSDGDRPGAFPGAALSEGDQSLPVQGIQPL